MSDLKTGDLAPHFRLATDGGGTVDLGELLGKTIVLYFYPKDDTPGCTTQAIEFSKASAAFAEAGAIIIGVSKDSVKKHDKFKAKHDLTVQLASDEDGAVIEAYGSWVLKKLYGREYMGIDRSTFLIGPDGRLVQIWHKVKVKSHVDAVLAAVQGMAKA
ncbi:peroxiredoxin [Maricaulis sp.]|uniref:peroxiredoxin n=1 Tax=Maricaulis sp. TaxID=1486257 RepID=UPI003A8D439A